LSTAELNTVPDRAIISPVVFALPQSFSISSGVLLLLQELIKKVAITKKIILYLFFSILHKYSKYG
jgi:hypothetical protein